MLKVEIAKKPRDLEKGLMFRTKLPQDNGMLFIFDSPQHLNFWGRNTYIPLDIAFVNPDGVIEKISHISPLSEKHVSSDNQCAMAIEANLGYFSYRNVKSGDKITIDELSDKTGMVLFHKVI